MLATGRDTAAGKQKEDRPVSQDKGAERQLPSRAIAEAIRSQIESGELPPGAQLPSERDLASTYGTARNTAREAVRLLSDAGLVITDQGKGSFVRPLTPLIRLGNDRYSPKYRETGLSPFLLECAKQGKAGRFEVLSIDRIQPPPEVAERLNVSAQTKSVLRRENVFYADADPVNRVTTYIPWTIAEGTGPAPGRGAPSVRHSRRPRGTPPRDDPDQGRGQHADAAPR